MLPPFVVTARPFPGHPWRYGRFDEVEVLSRASPAATRWWVRGVERGLRLQRRLLPEPWRSTLSPLPDLIIDDVPTEFETNAAAAVPPARQETVFAHAELNPLLPFTRTYTSYTYADNGATFAARCNLYGESISTEVLNNNWGIYFRLDRHRPLYPRWFEEGMDGPFGLFNLVGGGFVLYPSEGLLAPEHFVSRAQFWVSDAQTEALQILGKKAAKEIRFLPWAEFFGGTPPADPEDARLWSCQAALFVRWALLDPQRPPERTASFWRWVEAACDRKAGERAFHDCFGFSFSDLETRLRAYLPSAVDSQVALTGAIFVPNIRLRMASHEEVARIIGGWLRMKGASLLGKSPAAARVYFDEAAKLAR